MLTLTNEMMRAIIMDHSSNPTNKHVPTKDGYESIHLHSTNCIDDIYLYILTKNNIVEDACFDGTACTITLSSTDILCEQMKGKDKEQVFYMIEQYNHMMHEEPYDAEVLEEALAFVNTHKQAARIRCATIGWNGAKDILEGKK